ncbi:hypothetical protein BO71DRAFT_430253 [Aspergillus ellipticus CBS 707.79]|uniref:Uncharacterized protein n=1 Tax=Aspergillus ellipticus CBS 707.79 TaxID=1448320 RepID=A0A319D9W8_9EURO|nr:hypothetical protein BO71DRAFT_430253 [Aspergillus ellipticus CBS 707.79]
MHLPSATQYFLQYTIIVIVIAPPASVSACRSAICTALVGWPCYHRRVVLTFGHAVMNHAAPAWPSLHGTLEGGPSPIADWAPNAEPPFARMQTGV